METSDIKDELIYIANSKIKETKLSYRQLSSKISSANLVLLGRLSNYKCHEIKIDKLMTFINEIDLFLHDRIFGFSFEIKDNVAIITYKNNSPK
jgi:predicted XRE-type DNA-binding protein